MYDLAIPLLGRKEIFVHPRHGNTIHSSQEVDTTHVSIIGWMDKQNVVYTHNGILFGL